MDTTRRDSDPGTWSRGRDDPDLATLSEDMMAADPMTQFALWMSQAQAQGLPEPTAMVLATTSEQGRPRARTVLLKAHDQAGFAFYSNRTSRKGHDVAGQQRAVLLLQAASITDQRVGQQAVTGHRFPCGA